MASRPICLLAACLFLLSPATAIPGPAASLESPADAAESDSAGLDLLLDPVTGQARLIVGYAGFLPPALVTLLDATGGRIVRQDAALEFALVELPEAAVTGFLLAARAVPGVTYAKPDGAAELFFTPNDPRYAEQWGPPAIHLPEAWDTTRGDHSIMVSVVDTGIAYDHPDLAANVCSVGYDFGEDDADPYDTYGHGTHVAGTVAAAIDNAVGVAGMGDVCLQAVKIEAFGGLTWAAAASGVQWAADNGADVIQMSWGGYADPGAPLSTAIANAAAAGVLLIAAAGNAGCTQVGFPAAYLEVVAVAALQSPGDARASFSSCGPEVEVAAPGKDILSTLPYSLAPSGYGVYSGTSMAAPHTSGVAALFWTQHPALTAADVRCVLAQNSVDLGTLGRDIETGFGRIDAAAMLANPSCTPEPPEAPVVTGLSGDATALLGWNTPFAWGAVTGYEVFRGVSPDALSSLAVVATVNAYEDATVAVGQTWWYAVEAVNGAGNGARSAAVAVTVREALDLPYSLGFEAGLDGWTTTGLWHVTSDRAASGGSSAYFGLENGPGLADNNYDTGVRERGALTSPPIDLTAASLASLSFWSFQGLEGFVYEHPILEVSTASAPGVWLPAWAYHFPQEGAVSADLSAYVGQVVHLRFVVDTLDAYSNDFEGWYVDDLSLSAAAATPYAPELEAVVPEAGELLGASTLVGGYYHDANGAADVVSVEMSLDGSAWVASQLLYGFVWLDVFEGLTTGTHTVAVRATDSTGLLAETEVTFDVDGDPPAVAITEPADGAEAACTLQVSGTASDAGAGVYRVRVFLDGVRLDTEYFWPPVASTPWSLAVSLATVAEGSHVLTAQATDDVGNVGSSAPVSIVRLAADCVPHAAITSPVAGTVVDCDLLIEGTATAGDEGANLGWVDLYLGGRYVGGADLGDARSASWSVDAYRLGDVPSGTQDLVAYVFDVDWVRGASAPVSVTRSTVDCRPQVTLTAPTDGTVANCRIDVAGTATARSGTDIDYVRIRLDGWTEEYVWGGDPELSWSISIGVGGQVPGTHILLAEARQSDGNLGQSTAVTFVRSDFDCRPTVAITSPTPGTAANCVLAVSGTASAIEGETIDWVALYAGGVSVGYAENISETGEWSGTAGLGQLPAGAAELIAVAYDTAGSQRASEPLPIVRNDVQCLPVLVLDTPAAGATVSGVTAIAGTVDFGDPANGASQSAYLELWIDFDYVTTLLLEGDGPFSYAWNTYREANGPHRIDAYLYSDEDGFIDAFVRTVTVSNLQDPHVTLFEADGTVGCSAGIHIVRTLDQCGDADAVTATLEPGLTSLRVTLDWTADQVAGLDSLSVLVLIGAQQWSATAAAGEGSVTLEVDGAGALLTDDLASARIEARAAHGQVYPAVVLNEDFHVEAEWAYWYAALP